MPTPEKHHDKQGIFSKRSLLVYSGDYGEHSVQIGRAPIRAEIASPGDYMLFVLDAARVPSMAKVITLTR